MTGRARYATVNLLDTCGCASTNADHYHHQPSFESMTETDSFTSALRAADTDLDVGCLVTSVLELGDPTAVLRSVFADNDCRARLPEVAALDMDQGGRTLHKDNLDHTIQVVARTPRRDGLVGRWAALCHDLGKPATRRIHGDGTVTFHGHETVGTRITRQFLSRLGQPAGLIDDVNNVVTVTGRLGADTVGIWSDSAVRRLTRDAGPLFDVVLDLARADCTSRRPGRQAHVAAAVDAFAARSRELQAYDAAARRRPPLDGAAVMALLDLEPGPEVGVAMRWLYQHHLDTGSDQDAVARDLVAWWSSRTTS